MSLQALEVALSPLLCWIHGPTPQNSCPAKCSAPTSHLNSLYPRLSLKRGSPGSPASRSRLPRLKCCVL